MAVSVPQKITTTSFFDLNIEKVLEDWGVHHGLREVIANAMDEQRLTQTENIQIFKDEHSVWHIKDFGRGLTYEHLTQNENEEKLTHSNLVLGKFGVGLKDALATFDRNGIELIIKSKHGDITIEKTHKHSFEHLVTLHAVINPPSEPNMKGTEFFFKNACDEDIEAAKNLFLEFSNENIIEKTEYGEVILKKGKVSRIYVNGLRVAEEENFLFSYNITSLTAVMRKALNRERTNVGRTAYTPRVKAILLACKTVQVGQRLITDLEQFTTGLMHDELKWIDVSTHATRILNSSKDKVMFITSDQLVSDSDFRKYAEEDGQQIVVVPDKVAEKIRGLTDLSGRPMRDLDQYIEERYESFEFDFVDPKDFLQKEKEVFNHTDKIFQLIGGRPPSIKSILISNTMRPESGHNPLGVWSDESTIVILRSELLSLEKYAGTLLHLAAFPLSDARPLSAEFEDQLTVQLGMVAVCALKTNDHSFEITHHKAKKEKREEDESDTRPIQPLKRRKTSKEIGEKSDPITIE